MPKRLLEDIVRKHPNREIKKVIKKEPELEDMRELRETQERREIVEEIPEYYYVKKNKIKGLVITLAFFFAFFVISF